MPGRFGDLSNDRSHPPMKSIDLEVVVGVGIRDADLGPVVAVLAEQGDDHPAADRLLVHGSQIDAVHIAGLVLVAEDEVAGDGGGHLGVALEGEFADYLPGLVAGAGRGRCAGGRRRNQAGENIDAEGIAILVVAVEVFGGKDGEIGDVRRLRVRIAAEGDGDAADGQIDCGRAVQRWPGNGQRGSQRDGDADSDADAPEADLEGEGCPHGDPKIDLVVEGIPGDEEVGVSGEPDVGAGDAVSDLKASAGHDAGVGEGKVALALHGGSDGQAPAEAEARDIGELGGLQEMGIVAADGDDELTLREPHEVGKAAGELAVLVEDVGVGGELGLNGQNAFGAAETRFQGQFDADQRGVVGGNRQPGHADDSDFDATVEGHIDNGRHVDDDEGGPVQADSEPQAAALGGGAIPNLPQLAHGVVGQRAAIIQRRDEDEAGNLVHVIGHDQFAVVTDAQANRLDFDDRGNSDDDEQPREDEDAGVVAVCILGFGVGPDCDQTEFGDLDQQHTVVFDGGTVVVLEQGSGDGDAGGLETESQALQVQCPVAGVQDRLEWDGDAQFVHLPGERRS